MEEMQVGKVTHYFTKIGVAVIKVTDGSIKVGDELHIKGHTSDFRQKVNSMQIEHENVQLAEPGQSIGIKVEQSVRANDLVYKEM
jgi:translation elongation factor EF-1alpha